MIILRKLFILIFPCLFAGFFQVHAEETSCYVTVYIKEKQKKSQNRVKKYWLKSKLI